MNSEDYVLDDEDVVGAIEDTMHTEYRKGRIDEAATMILMNAAQGKETRILGTREHIEAVERRVQQLTRQANGKPTIIHRDVEEVPQ